MLAIYEKELKTYFRTPSGPVFIGLFLMASAAIFIFLFLVDAVVEYNSYLTYVNLVFMITTPILTMRTFSEERKLKTDQMLITSPVKVSAIVGGKFFAAVTVFFVTLLIHSLNAIIISFFATNMFFVDILVAYIGLFLVGCTYIAIGILVSSMTESQVVSAIVTLGAMLLLFAVQWMTSSISSSIAAGIITCFVIALAITALLYFTTKNWIASLCVFVGLSAVIVAVIIININIYAGLLNSIVTWFSVIERFYEFTSGSVSISSLVYLISFPLALLYITVYQIEKRRWA